MEKLRIFPGQPGHGRPGPVPVPQRPPDFLFQWHTPSLPAAFPTERTTVFYFPGKQQISFRHGSPKQEIRVFHPDLDKFRSLLFQCRKERYQ